MVPDRKRANMQSRRFRVNCKAHPRLASSAYKHTNGWVLKIWKVSLEAFVPENVLKLKLASLALHCLWRVLCFVLLCQVGKPEITCDTKTHSRPCPRQCRQTNAGEHAPRFQTAVITLGLNTCKKDRTPASMPTASTPEATANVLVRALDIICRICLSKRQGLVLQAKTAPTSMPMCM